MKKCSKLIYFSAMGIVSIWANNISAKPAVEINQLSFVQPPQTKAWNDYPRTRGDWRLSLNEDGSTARYLDQNENSLFQVDCRVSIPSITIWRAGHTQGSQLIKIRTETLEEVFRTRSSSGISIELEPTHPLLDAMSITIGRFSVEVEGMETLYLPAWAEFSRVVEDCR